MRIAFKVTDVRERYYSWCGERSSLQNIFVLFKKGDKMYAVFKHIKLIALQDIRLYFSPFIGAFKAIKIELARPKSSGIKNIILSDVRLYFAPFIGAIDGIKKEIF